MTVKQYVKRILSIFLVFCLVGGSMLVRSPHAAYAGDTTEKVEHFPNGDFENTEYDYTQTWWTDGNGSSLVETENGGNRVLHVKDLKPNGCVFAGFSMEANKTYTISFEIKATVEASVGLFHLFNHSWEVLKAHEEIAAEWKRYTYEYTPTKAETGLIFQNNPQATANINFYIDNFSVTTLEESKTDDKMEHFPNGDFENTEYDYTQTWWTDGNGTSLVETENGGNRVLHIKDLKPNGCVFAGVGMEANKTYTISFDIKATTEQNVGLFHLFNHSWEVLKAHEEIAAGWKRYTYEYTPTKAETGLIFQNNPQATANIDFYIDNFSVTTLEEPKTEEVMDYIPNGDFENTEYDYTQTWWTDGNGTSSVEAENSENRVLYIKDLKPNGCVFVGVNMRANKTYTISFDIKAATEQGVGLFHLFNHSWEVVKAHQEITAGWKRYTYEYTPTKAETGLIFQNVGEATANIEFYIDNFSVTSALEENVKTTLSEGWIGIEDGKNAYTMHLKTSNYAELITEFGEWSWFEGEVLIDGVATKLRFNLGSDLFATFDSIPQGTKTIEIPIGTKFIDEDGSSSKLLVTDNKFTLSIPEPKPEVYNDIKISYDSINGEAGFYFKAEIVDGPDKGKLIGAEAYGEWMSPSFGPAFYSVAGEMTEINISYSPINDQIYISGFPQLSTLDGITLKEGTIIRPLDTAQNTTPMRIVNTVELEHDKEHGRWGNKGELEEPDMGEVMEYIPNGDFENKSYDYSQTWWTDTNGFYSLQTEGEGNRVLHVKKLKPNGCVYVGVNMKANKTYTISFDIKATNKEGEGLFHLFNHSWELVKAHQEITTGWKRYTFEYTPTKAETGLIIQNVAEATANIDFYIDNFSVTSTIGENVKTTLSKTWLGIEDGKKAYTMHLKTSNYADLIAEFGEGSWFEGEVLIDGVATKLRFNLGSNLFATFDSIPKGTTSIEIPIGTEFIDEDGSSSKLLVIGNKFTLSINEPKPEVYNDIKISLESINGEAGFYFKAKIVAGPDKGKIIGTEAYGEWMSPSFGLATYSVDGEKTEINISYSPINDQIYISGFPQLSTLDGITLKKGTIIRPLDTAQNTTPMRIVNTVELEQDKVYGRWGYRGKVKTPTEFYDVVVSVERIGGYSATLIAEFADGSKKNLAEIFGENVVLTGATTIVDPGLGKYTNKNTQYLVQSNGTIAVCVDFAMPDSVEIKKGTVLWPAESSKVQKPVRIVNRIYFDRNAEDEWRISAGAADDEPANGNEGIGSPQTGDGAPITEYAGIMVVAIMGVFVCVYKRKKRRVQI